MFFDITRKSGVNMPYVISTTSQIKLQVFDITDTSILKRATSHLTTQWPFTMQLASI